MVTAASRRAGFGVDLRFHRFFDRPAVNRHMDRRTRGLLSAAGAYIRTAARSSLKRGRQKTLAEMEPEERQRYAIRARIARQRGRRKPRRPEKASAPGEPPRLHMRPSPLKRLILFAFDPARQSVVVGPLRFGRRASLDALEYGGMARIRGRRRRVRARPFMRPALAAGIAALKRKTGRRLPRRWEHLAGS